MGKWYYSGEFLMKNTQNRKVPNRVLQTIEKVRASGMTSMFDRNGVLMLSGIYDHWSDVWLDKFCGNNSNRNNYSKVLDQFSQWLRSQP